jgi:hypothetical protein
LGGCFLKGGLGGGGLHGGGVQLGGDTTLR